MRIVLQRVSEASVRVAGEVVGEIGGGFLVLLGIEEADGLEDVEWLVGKVVQMRVFADDEGKMNRHLAEVGGGLLVVSQFTLHASTKKGNRPSFVRAARPEHAVALYNAFLRMAGERLGREVQRGRFGADMQVALVNDGPVTIAMDSRNRE